MTARLAALVQLSRLGNILRDSAHVLALVTWIAARPPLDGTLLLAVAAAMLTLLFAHMVNDIEDAADDARDPDKRRRNAVSSGKLTRREAWRAAAVLGAAAAALHLLLPAAPRTIGLSVLLVGLLYSWRPVRLKGRPGLDLLGHGWIGAAGIILFFTALPGATFDAASMVIVCGAFLFSVGGDLYNETRDWEVDRAAGLDNSASRLGYRKARRLMAGLYVAGVLLVSTGATGLAF